MVPFVLKKNIDQILRDNFFFESILFGNFIVVLTHRGWWCYNVGAMQLNNFLSNVSHMQIVSNSITTNHSFYQTALFNCHTPNFRRIPTATAITHTKVGACLLAAPLSLVIAKKAALGHIINAISEPARWRHWAFKLAIVRYRSLQITPLRVNRFIGGNSLRFFW